tara:strand:- start:2305 stop:2580 length:276 start_codon:yes stop_codon:yes gene_type:complete
MSYSYSSTSIEDSMRKKNKDEKEKKPRKKTQKELFEKSKNISESEMKKLKEHSKMHKGGMSSKHMKNMIKFMKQGDTFSKAHNKAKKLDNK